MICRCGANPDGLCGECWLSGEADDTISPSDQGLTLPVSKLETMQGNSEHSPKLPPVAVIKPSPVMPCAAFRPGGSFRGCSMHYFKRNIGDYHKKAGRLSMLEHGAYTLLLDACYDRERFPTKDEAIDWCWARTVEEVAAVEFVLAKFFVLQDGRFVQERIAEEIDKYHQNANTNKRIALEREAKRKDGENVPSTKRARRVNEPPPNHKPITNNQEPISRRFTPPTLQEVINEMTGRTQDPTHEANRFLAYYQSNGWKVGKNPMKSWKAAVTNWVTRNQQPKLINPTQTGVAMRLTDTSWAD